MWRLFMLLTSDLALVMKPDSPVIIYGSQTGQSQAIAEEIQTRLTTAGLQSQLFCMDQINKEVG